MSDEEFEAALEQLARQQAIQTDALRAACEGRWQGGADTVAGHVHALNPTLDLEPKTPLYADG